MQIFSHGKETLVGSQFLLEVQKQPETQHLLVPVTGVLTWCKSQLHRSHRCDGAYKCRSFQLVKWGCGAEPLSSGATKLSTARCSGITFDRMNLILPNVFLAPAEIRPAIQIKVLHMGAGSCECTVSRLLQRPVWEGWCNHAAFPAWGCKSVVTISVFALAPHSLPVTLISFAVWQQYQ